MKNRVYFMMVFAFCVSGYSATITVDDDGPADFNTIQAAINSAMDGDIVIVEDGLYKGTGNRNMAVSKSIMLKSKNGPSQCIIDCQSAINCFAFQIKYCDPIIEGFTIIRCSEKNVSEAISIVGSSCIIRNCIFTDNASCVYCWDTSGTYPVIINCTFYGNAAGLGGGAVGMRTNIHEAGYLTVANSIFWGNEPNDIDFDFHMCKSGPHPGMHVEFSMLQSTWQNRPSLSYENCSYEQYPEFADPLNRDFHLKSQMGRWDVIGRRWVKDNITSLGIDFGDENDDFTNELWPHGRRINAGAYGNTSEASLSVVSISNPSDIDIDDKVTLDDFSLFSMNWESINTPNRNDFNRDNAVDILDLIYFSQNWLAHNIDPYIILSKSEYIVDEPISVSLNSMAGNQYDWVGICEQGASIEPWDGVMIQWCYSDGTKTGSSGIINNVIQFDGMKAGNYEVRVFFDNQYEIKNRVLFTVK
ncbi:MAG TPA: hypothetical protein PKB02_18550 [Anaerohalosphaeraceae bacterium]|nr:hypothetical protein [Anaerohalosphaeraceae bacterium]